MKNLLTISALLLATALISCQKEPCEDLFGAAKVSCVQCEETGFSDYIQGVEKPAGFPTINLDSLHQYGRDSVQYRLGSGEPYDIVYGQDQCPGDDINGYIYIKYHSNSSSTRPFEVGEFHKNESYQFRYKIAADGQISYP